jgi:glyoxylase-like metal-dependent hydrolase (beta-lactamase superfamily II)
MANIITIDTRLHGYTQSIAVYAIPYTGGAILIDPGPGSTVETVVSAMAEHHLSPKRVTHVLLTHIHLDHAGAAGWFARRGAQVFVHPAGAPHMLNPERLLASARRIYNDRMETTWGEFLPVPADHLNVVEDGERVQIGELEIQALHTPGHADHHAAYLIDKTCFCGDIGGERKPGWKYVRLPFVPPETNLEKWRESLKKLQAESPEAVALTQFGLFQDASAHLMMARQFLDDVERWLDAAMPAIPDVETMKDRLKTWLHERGRALKFDERTLTMYDFSGPEDIGASGLFRYWHKVRMGEK